LQLETPINW